MVSTVVRGQQDMDAERKRKIPAVSLSYFGEQLLINPGIQVGAELPFYVHVKEKKKEGLASVLYPKRSAHMLFAALHMGYYFHKGSHEMLFSNVNIGLRHTSPSGIFKEISIGGGYSKTILPAVTYRLGHRGTVEEDKKSGTYYRTLLTSVRLGYDFSHKGKSNLPLAVFVGASLFNLEPYQFFFYPHYGTEIGISYKFMKHK